MKSGSRAPLDGSRKADASKVLERIRRRRHTSKIEGVEDVGRLNPNEASKSLGHRRLLPGSTWAATKKAVPYWL